MKNFDAKQLLWVEKYRPQKISDTILPESTKNIFMNFVRGDKVPNLLLSGGPGVGKTTVARAMLEELGSDYIIKNGSLNVGVDVLRHDISVFASSVSFSGGRKYVIFDEADYLPSHIQPALRNYIEEFSKNCGFIFTCNYKNKIIEPLRSRLSNVDFRIEKNSKVAMASEFFKRVLSILDNENIPYDRKVITSVVKKYFPDFRKTLNELQTYAASGKIDEGILSSSFNEESIILLFQYLKNKEFGKMRKWVTDHSDEDTNELFKGIYEMGYTKVQNKTLPNFIVLLGDYMYKSSFVADPEINLMAFLTEVMMECEYV